MEHKLIYSLREVGELVGVHRATIRRAIQAGKLKASKIAGSLRVSGTDLEAWYREGGGGRLWDDSDVCTCDENCDGECSRHWRENRLQDRAIEAENELVRISELVGKGGDGTPFGRVESLLSELTALKDALCPVHEGCSQDLRDCGVSPKSWSGCIYRKGELGEGD
jgi:excisionase family DNA binding protein